MSSSCEKLYDDNNMNEVDPQLGENFHSHYESQNNPCSCQRSNSVKRCDFQNTLNRLFQETSKTLFLVTQHYFCQARSQLSHLMHKKFLLIFLCLCIAIFTAPRRDESAVTQKNSTSMMDAINEVIETESSDVINTTDAIDSINTINEIPITESINGTNQINAINKTNIIDAVNEAGTINSINAAINEINEINNINIGNLINSIHIANEVQETNEVKLFGGFVKFTPPNHINSISSDSICERLFVQIKELQDESLNRESKVAAEKLYQFEQDIQQNCPPFIKARNLEMCFQVVLINQRASVNDRFLEWLAKIENILYSNQAASLKSETLTKAWVVLASLYTQQGRYSDAQIAVEKASRSLGKCSGPIQETNYLKSWLKEISGEIYLVQYMQSNDSNEKASFYKFAEAFYNEAISLRKGLKINRLVGSAQCKLAKLYIEAKEFEKAEQINNDGISNILHFPDETQNRAFCFSNDAQIKAGRG